VHASECLPVHAMALSSVQLPSSVDGLKKLKEDATRLLSKAATKGSGRVHGAEVSSDVDTTLATPIKAAEREQGGDDVGGEGGGESLLTPLTALKRRTQAYLDDNRKSVTSEAEEEEGIEEVLRENMIADEEGMGSEDIVGGMSVASGEEMDAGAVEEKRPKEEGEGNGGTEEEDSEEYDKRVAARYDECARQWRQVAFFSVVSLVCLRCAPWWDKVSVLCLRECTCLRTWIYVHA